MITLAAGMFLIDTLQYNKTVRIGIVFGANAITVYVLADLLALLFYGLPFGGESLNELFTGMADHSFFPGKFLSLAYALLFIAINFLPAYWLYRKKIFIKL
ncbi:hypothetical protein ES705_23207 [subsurface metagenome]